MRLKVIKQYVDKYTKELIYPDTIIKDIADWWIKELLDARVVEEIPEKPKTKLNKDE